MNIKDKVRIEDLLITPASYIFLSAVNDMTALIAKYFHYFLGWYTQSEKTCISSRNRSYRCQRNPMFMNVYISIFIK